MKKTNEIRSIQSRSISGNTCFKRICALAFMVLTCFLFLLASSFFSRSQSWQGKMFSLSGSSVSRNQARDMFSGEQETEFPVSFALWRQIENQRAENSELKQSAEITVIELAGNDWQAVFGKNGSLDESDDIGCLISPDIAFSLFGDQDVSGKKVEWDSYVFEIRGLLEGHEGIFAIRAADMNLVSSGNDEGKEQTGKVFTALHTEDHFNMLGFSRQISDEELSQFKSRHGIDPIEINLSFFSAANYLSMNFLSFFVLFLFSFLFVRKANTEKYRPVLRASLFFGTILVFPGIWIILQLGFQPDSRFFPTKIADFSFWGKMINQLGEELSRLFSHFSDIPIRNMFIEMGKCFLSGITACVLGLFIQRLVRIDSETKWFIFSILSLFAAFIATVAANAAEIRFPYMPAVFLFFPLLFLRKYILLQFGFSGKPDLQGWSIAKEAEIHRIG